LASYRFHVLAVAASLDAGMLNVFLQSWRQYSPQTRIVLWVEGSSPLGDHGVPVEVHRFSQTTNAKLVKMQR
jgi:hypothetical protein